jgi:outer membrane protein TolC
MKIIRILSVFLFITLFSHPAVFSQAKQAFDPFKDEIKDKLPPLSVLLDSAIISDPSVRFRKLQSTVNNFKLKETQYEWSRNLGLQANLGWGTFDYLYNNTVSGENASTYVSNQSLTQYGIGAYMRFPAFDVIGRKNLIRLAKAEISQADEMYGQQTKELREKVIMQYNDLIVKQRIMKIRLKYVETSRINMQMAENQFTDGVIPVAEFARITQIITQAETEFESSKMDFQTAYMILEETVGMKFNIY